MTKKQQFVRGWSPAAFQVMVKPRGAICNLACEYCYFLKKEALYPGSAFRMSDELLARFTAQYIAAHNGREVTFAWQGGEPTLMGLDFFRKAVDYQKLYAPPGTRVSNTLQTNATLLDAEWAQFFKDHHFLVGVSLDGPQALHDAYRKNKGGTGSFKSVLDGISVLKKYQVDINLLCTVNAANVHQPLDVYRYFRDQLDSAFIQFIPIVERVNPLGEQRGNKVSKRSVTGAAYGKFLIAIFDEWASRDVGAVFVQLFDVALGKWLGIPGGLCVFDETCGLGLALEHNGDLFSCDHFVEPKYKLGNIIKAEMVSMVNSLQQYHFGMDKKKSLPKWCLRCEFKFACNGGCPKNRFKQTPDGEPGLNYLCEGYLAFFNHINPVMSEMARLVRMNRS